MKNLNKKLFLFVIVLSFSLFANKMQSQSIYKSTNSKETIMKMNGTSTLHNWTMSSQFMNCKADFAFQSGTENTLKSINSLNFSLLVKTLKSNEKAMDETAYEALKANQYKEIVFNMTSAVIVPQQKNNYTIRVDGNLSISGVTKKVSIYVVCQVNEDKSITCKGSYKLKMTDYNVKPPTFLWGAMSTGNEITLTFNLLLKN